MNKIKINNFRILYIFTLLFLMIPSVVNAEDTTSFSYKIKSVVNGANSAMGAGAKYCYTYGCRSGNTGVKISVVKDNNGVVPLSVSNCCNPNLSRRNALWLLHFLQLPLFHPIPLPQIFFRGDGRSCG